MKKNNNKKIKKISIEKKNKLMKAMLIVIASFCSVCCFALNPICGLILLALGSLMAYITQIPVEMPQIEDFLKAVNINDQESEKMP